MFPSFEVFLFYFFLLVFLFSVVRPFSMKKEKNSTISDLRKKKNCTKYLATIIFDGTLFRC